MQAFIVTAYFCVSDWTSHRHFFLSNISDIWSQLVEKYVIQKPHLNVLDSPLSIIPLV